MFYFQAAIEMRFRQGLRSFPWGASGVYPHGINRMGNPETPAAYLERAQRSAVESLERTVRELRNHPTLERGWR